MPAAHPAPSSTTPVRPDSVRGSGPSTEDFPLTGPPLFVSGCNRGGTTILTRLLAAHPEVRDIGRGQFNEGQFIWRRRFPDWSRHRWALPPWRWYLRRTEAHATPALVEFFRREFAAAMPEPGRLLEKTPANAVRIPFIDRVYPDAFFVHIIRDGRHTSASLMARRVSWLYAPHQWVNAHRIALADLERLPPERVVILRYEELMDEPERVLGEVCRRCDLGWGAAERDLVMGTARQALKDVECRWARLPPWQQRYILSVIREQQAALGYPVNA